MSDLDINPVKRGVMAAIRECQFMPSVHELRKLAGAADSRIDAKDRPLLAWQATRGAFSKVGAYDSPEFDDAVINATIRELGGWLLLCDTPSDEMHWLEKRFCAIYSALCSVKLPTDQTKRLAGITEVGNGREGYGSAPISDSLPHVTKRCQRTNHAPTGTTRGSQTDRAAHRISEAGRTSHR
ncbi:MAG: DUF6475 domain-containing protein [Planctomycetia bacterium]|nr:DUF6475 domain-containing protein [Planctomycetia bacterium]